MRGSPNLDAAVSFFQEFSSCTLIDVFQSYSVSIIGKSSFTNIWLVDRHNPFTTTSISEEDRGLILYVANSVGKIQIGDSESRITFSNFTGFLNPDSAARFLAWNISLWNQTLLKEYSSLIQYGLGAMLFNTLDSNS